MSRSIIVVSTVAVVCLSAQSAVARSLLHRGAGGVELDGAGNGGKQQGLAALRTGIDLELSSLSVKSAATAESGAYFQFANASVAGHEVGCINCDTELFARWVKQSRGFKEAACKEAPSAYTGSKHPNSPGYKAWQKKNGGGASFLSEDASAAGEARFLDREPNKACNHSDFDASDVKISVIRDWDLDALRPKLQALWSQRHLVIGAGANPLHQQMDFGEALMSLARNAPMVTPEECEKGDVPHCNSLFNGLRVTAPLNKLNTSMVNIFGNKFMEEHRYRSDMSEAEQRKHIQAVLTKLKTNYFFYYQKCLSHEEDTLQCNEKADSQILGQVACQDQDDEVQDDCVYAELRFCTDCKDVSSFFEYSRFHGPMALFDTKHNRKSVMGQCEEFSRAGHALMSLLGYEARYVLDFTDHVWIEIKIPKGPEGKWVHADPSEGVLDSPLMYETGWGKKLTMIFAFTPWSVEHVTKRYTAKYDETVQRRLVSDDRLNEVVAAANHRLKYELPLNSWGYQVAFNSKARTLREVSLWQHFESS